jgi:hypothetical protein
MYRLHYYPNLSNSKVSVKDFDTMEEAFKFLFKMPSGTLIELNLCKDTDTQKPDRN